MKPRKSISSKKKIISGIHNYCDRWCERCSFVSRCAVGIEEQSLKLTEEDLDIENEKFWQRLSENFSKAREMLLKAADEIGIDLQSIINSPEAEQAHELSLQHREEAENSPVSELSAKYAEDVSEWFEENENILRQKINEWHTAFELGGMDDDSFTGKTFAFNDAIEVLRWYLFFIHAKLIRAMHGRDEDDDWFEENNLPKDSDGSAKIALIAVDRCIEAWAALCNYIPEKADDILTFLAQLEKLRKMTESEFPNARNFVRPGFDS